MRDAVLVVHDLVAALAPWDEVEAEHQADTLRWLEATDDVFRRAKPATPNRHLVSYFVLIDPNDGSSLLVDHINCGLWLPPGGHVEPDEQPAETVRREIREELGIEPIFAAQSETPTFLTVTRPVGAGLGHVDVSLWFHLHGRRAMTLRPDLTEFRSVRWWTPAEVADHDPAHLDPHYHRFNAKVRQ